MRVKRRSEKDQKAADVSAELGSILRPQRVGEPVCGAACVKSESFDCVRTCPDIPRAMSSDPDNFPLEPGIAPLVFEIKRLEVFEPCWSCEGHDGPDGTLWKVPRVWFYAESVVHVRVLSESLAELRFARRLNADWHVAITHSEKSNADTTFSLEPSLGGTPVSLRDLQADIETIAASLRDLVFDRAQKLSDDLS